MSRDGPLGQIRIDRRKLPSIVTCFSLMFASYFGGGHRFGVSARRWPAVLFRFECVAPLSLRIPPRMCDDAAAIDFAVDICSCDWWFDKRQKKSVVPLRLIFKSYLGAAIYWSPPGVLSSYEPDECPVPILNLPR